MILVLLADGFEEIEALTPIDMLRRAGANVKTVGINGKIARGAHGISVVCDAEPDEINLADVSMAIFPGGMPGATNLDASPFTDKVIEAVNNNGGRLAAICAAPLVLGRRGLLSGKIATCYPGFEKDLIGATITNDYVITDGNITTAKGMGVALDFAEELVSLVLGESEAKKISKSIYRSGKGKRKKAKPAPEKKPLPVFDDAEVAEMAEKIDSAFTKLGICADIVGAKKSTRLTRYNIVLEGNQKASKIQRLIDDITIEINVNSLTMITPDEDTVIIEIPNKKAEIVELGDILDSDEFRNAESSLSVALGRDFDGDPIIADLKKLPHMLIGGATGMGKSMVIHSIIRSILSKASADEVQLVLIDPKMVEFNMYEGIPHLKMPIITDMKQAVEALAWAHDEMERRYALMSHECEKNIDSYNIKVGKDALPKIVIIIDELADLMFMAKKDTENYILRLAQKSRAAGIHLIIATQRPTSNVITGLIKANIPTRMCLKVMSHVDSRTVLDMKGAERLLGAGDALYHPVGSTAPIRIQTPFIPDDELYCPQDLLK